MQHYIELLSMTDEYSIGNNNNLKKIFVNGDVDISGNIAMSGNINCNEISGNSLTVGTANVGSLSVTGTVTAGATTVDSLVTAQVSGGYGFGTIHGGFTTLTGLYVSGNASLNNVTVNSLSGNLIGNVTGYVTGTVSSLSNHNTDDLAQGSNKYYSDALVNNLLNNTNSSGGGVSYNNGVFSIDQSITPDNTPTFKGMTLTDITDASYGLIDFQHNFGAGSGIYGAPTGKHTMAQIDGNLRANSGGSGGQLCFRTKANNGALIESLRIENTGAGNYNSNFDNLSNLYFDGMIVMRKADNSRQTYIYNSTPSSTSFDVDLHIDTYSDSADMGISFSTQSSTRMRIAKNGDVNVAGTMNVGSLSTAIAQTSAYGPISAGDTAVTTLTSQGVADVGRLTTMGKVTAYDNIETSSKLVASQLEIAAGANGLTQFNYTGNGKNYIRGTDTYCDTDFQIKDDKFLEFGNLQPWFLQSGVIWFNLLYAYTHVASQQQQNELNFGFNNPSTVGSWSKLLTITGSKIHYRRPLQNSSDDRLKHNETNIVKGLNIIRQLQPEKYQKTVEMYEADYKGVIDEPSVWEAGLIAQKVLQIPELTDYVAGGDIIGVSGEKIENAYSLDYNSISMYSLAAIKELDAIVQAQQSKIDSLEARLTALENTN